MRRFPRSVKGEQLDLPQGPGAYTLKGKFTGPEEALALNAP